MTFLSPDELRELTDRARPGDQIRWLREHKWRFEVSATGRPRVARAYFEHRLGAPAADVVPLPARPNLAILKAL